MYEKYFKRPFDILCALAAIIVFSLVFLVVAVLVRIKLGKPVLFKQERPGKDEKIFKLYKFRSMTDKTDENGNLLPDELRLTSFGKTLRMTSLDELPEAFNILKGDMSVVGPRPQLVRDMVFMDEEQRKRHTARPGLTGLAQVNGRNNTTWETRFEYDLKYIENITFMGDVRIILKTIIKCLSRDGITEEGMATAEDFGDYLLKKGEIEQSVYEDFQITAANLLMK
ncbi:MAG TPA: sugar transferase [Oscillospiraceae bacterium]|nr:sugar transferase [Oscillospiraceae bacterium]